MFGFYVLCHKITEIFLYMRYALRKFAWKREIFHCGFINAKECSFLSFNDIRFFKSISFFLVHYFQDKTQYQRGNAQTCQHDERHSVVVGHGGLFPCDGSALKIGNQLRICIVENFANEQREEPQANVLNPEDQGVCASDNF